MARDSESTGCLRPPVDLLIHYALMTFRRYKKLTLRGKLFIWSLLLFYIALGTFLLVIGPSTAAQFLYDLAQELSNLRFGWLVLVTAILVVSFPPLIGHTTLVTLCGFAYGMKGFFLAAGASLIGSGLAFIVLRFLFAERLSRWTSTNEKWTALEAVVRAKGLPLIILVRISPMPPWVYSNTLFASIESVQLWRFLVATTFNFPKYALYVFIGSRLASLSDGDQRKEMDTKTKVINGCLVGSSILVAIVASFVLYRLIQGHLRHSKGVSARIDELAAEAIEDVSEGAPLLDNSSSDSIDELAGERNRSIDIEP